MVVLFLAAVDVPLVDLELLPYVALLPKDELVQQAELISVAVDSRLFCDLLQLLRVGKARLEVAVRVLEAVQHFLLLHCYC